MDESTFETFEEELGSPLQEAPPKPIRQSRRPEMYAQRRMREEAANPQPVPKTVPRDAAGIRTNSMSGLRKALSMQSLTQVEVPFQGVTLNRCLFIAITILVITSGCQRLHETLRGQRDLAEEEEYGLSVRPSALKKHRHEPEPESSLWDTLFWWFPDDDDDDDDEEEGGRGRKKRGTREKSSKSLRNKSLFGKSLLKPDRGLKDKKEKRRKEEDERVRGKPDKARKRKIEEEDEDDYEDEDEIDEEEEVKPKKKQKKIQNAKESHSKNKRRGV